MNHGMILFPLDGSALATCLCGWYARIPDGKVDMAAVRWSEHHLEVLQLVVTEE